MARFNAQAFLASAGPGRTLREYRRGESIYQQGEAGDAVFYTARAERFLFGASNFFRGGQMAIFGGTPIRFLSNVPTAVGAHGVAFDETNNIVYTQD